ncbi:helicase-related protein [Pedobacter gandavensis]|uniref:helicase-related protein n=1 Tax=Pedobacter gandavensis TaxID=2679963 RepID=UPI00292F2836|nr:helicase-related protein [Pedobacter gandavensis]
MDRQQRTLDVVNALNSYNNGDIANYVLLNKVCNYFDFIKDEDLDEADKRFLIYLSNKAGVPHYYDILHKFNKNNNLAIEDEYIGINTISALLYECTLFTDDTSKLHQYQMDILKLFDLRKQNRYFLSASTSFGKTHLVYEVIKKMGYKNIALIFPSIALLTENLSKIKEGRITFPLDYKIHTLSDIDNVYGENNIFIFTPERFLSFLDKTVTSVHLDFIFVDEVYKIDNGYIIDDEVKENERDLAYRMAIFYGLGKFPNVDLLFAGPYIEIFNKDNPNYNPSFDLFLNDFKISKLLRNEYDIVQVTKNEVEKTKGKINIDEIEFDFTKKNTKRLKIQEILDRLIAQDENAIVYCNTQSNAEKVALQYETAKIDTSLFNNFLDHLKMKYDNSWVVIESLEKGIAVHHGVVPKYIQKEIVNLFNSVGSPINVLVSTTTITEGVNTTAKNMVVYKSEKGAGKNGKPLLTFDAKNIAGRAGRFMEHYKGRVISLDKAFIDKIDEIGNQIEHKNYQSSADRKEIDDDMTPSEFLDDRSKTRIEEIKLLQLERDIPDYIISQFKVISKRDKISMYDDINQLSQQSQALIKKLINDLNANQKNIFLNKLGFQVILDCIIKYIENEHLRFLISRTYIANDGIEASILYASLTSYIYNGFTGVYDYNYAYEEKLILKSLPQLRALNAEEKRKAVNNAMRKSSSLIYNTYKYQLVKYLGLFNLMYKFWDSKQKGLNFEEVSGIDKLLIKLEYNAFSDEARVASDYGVPQKIIDYYDSTNSNDKKAVLDTFDKYEKEIYQKVKKIIEE